MMIWLESNFVQRSELLMKYINIYSCIYTIKIFLMMSVASYLSHYFGSLLVLVILIAKQKLWALLASWNHSTSQPSRILKPLPCCINAPARWVKQAPFDRSKVVLWVARWQQALRWAHVEKNWCPLCDHHPQGWLATAFCHLNSDCLKFWKYHQQLCIFVWTNLPFIFYVCYSATEENHTFWPNFLKCNFLKCAIQKRI